MNPREAEAIVSLIKAMTQHPAYAGKTIGVISMVKEDQALLIQSLLHKRIDSVELEKRRILAGISAEFQGDERDIILLSLVDSAPEEAALRTVREGAYELVKKRYNVAASRARDQLWVVHSFDAHRDLKTDDLRFQLLQHAQRTGSRRCQAASPDAPSRNRRSNAKWRSACREAGFRVKQQMSVGHFRIDMVVEGERASGWRWNATATAIARPKAWAKTPRDRPFSSAWAGSSCAFAAARSIAIRTRRSGVCSIV